MSEEEFQAEKVSLVNRIIKLESEAFSKTMDLSEYNFKREELVSQVTKMRRESTARLADYNERSLRILNEKKHAISNESDFYDYLEACNAFITSNIVSDDAFYNKCREFLNEKHHEADANISNESESNENDFKQ